MKKTSLPKAVTILVLTLLTVVIWVALSIYRAIAVKPTTTVPEDILNPLNPKIDTSIIDDIESSLYFEDIDIPEIIVSGNKLPETAPTPIETPFPETEDVPTGSLSATEI